MLVEIDTEVHTPSLENECDFIINSKGEPEKLSCDSYHELQSYWTVNFKPHDNTGVKNQMTSDTWLSMLQWISTFKSIENFWIVWDVITKKEKEQISIRPGTWTIFRDGIKPSKEESPNNLGCTYYITHRIDKKNLNLNTKAYEITEFLVLMLIGNNVGLVLKEENNESTNFNETEDNESLGISGIMIDIKQNKHAQTWIWKTTIWLSRDKDVSKPFLDIIEKKLKDILQTQGNTQFVVWNNF